MDTKKIPVIIDCDPGHDDMMALVLAYGSNKLDIRAVTTVAGNNTIQNTTQNALNVLHHMGADDIPVAQGLQDPIVRKHSEFMERMYKSRGKSIEELVAARQNKITGAAVHGATGLDGFVFPAENPKQLEPVRAVEMMAKVLRESEEKITIIPTGPLTNVALLLRAFPDLHEKIERISMMGGTSEYILSRSFMEFNTFLDPEATKIVFESGLPITMYGYDVTYKVLYDIPFIERVKKMGNRTSKMVAALLEYFMNCHNSSMKNFQFFNVAPIHDACAVAGVIDPTLLTDVRPMHVDIETSGTFFDGATICDYEDKLNLPKNVDVVYNMDTERFLDLLANATEACL